VSNDAFSQLLYPMLSAQPSAAAAVVEELAAAPLEKAAESSRLRRVLLEEFGDQIVACVLRLAEAFGRGGRLLACGNGGSATSAAELASTLLSGSPALPALCLTNDIAVVTAIGNDISFNDIYERQLIALGRPEDVVVAVSTSGNSENLVRALRRGHAMGMVTVAICGYDGGRMAAEPGVDHCFVVRSSSIHRIQEVQSSLYHLLTELVRGTVQEERACV
jgi:D-sedoheptulose 7-phosphate isomerase